MSSTLIKVHDYLIKGPFEGTRSDIAAAIGIDLGTFQSVLNTVRRDWFVYTYGWTIPYVGRGCAPGKWGAIATTDPCDIIWSGNRKMTEDAHTTMRSVSAHFKLVARGHRKNSNKAKLYFGLAARVDKVINEIRKVEAALNN